MSFPRTDRAALTAGEEISIHKRENDYVHFRSHSIFTARSTESSLVKTETNSDYAVPWVSH